MKILISNKVYKQLNKLPEPTRKKCIYKIRELDGLGVPHGFRLRVGDYRIIYEVNQSQKEINILSVAHRKEVYKI